MSSINPPHDVRVLFRLPLPAIGPRHRYHEVPDLETFARLQHALLQAGLPPPRLLPQYRRIEEGKVVAYGLCFCHEHPEQVDSFKKCVELLALPVEFMCVSVLADFFRIMPDGKTLFADLYHWNPWEHQYRLEQVNDILLRCGLPRRKSLEFSDGRRILSVLGVWEDPDRPGEVSVRYAIAEADRRGAYSSDVRCERSHEVLLCLAAKGQVAVFVDVDDIREHETWRFPMQRVGRKPTNDVLHEEIVPGIPVAKFRVSALGDRVQNGRKQVFKVLRLDVDRSELGDLQLNEGPYRHGTLAWKPWQEVVRAHDEHMLDPATELMLTRLLRKYARPEELFGAA